MINKLIKTRRRIIKNYIKLTRPKSKWELASYWPDIKIKNNELYFRGERYLQKNYPL